MNRFHLYAAISLPLLTVSVAQAGGLGDKVKGGLGDALGVEAQEPAVVLPPAEYWFNPAEVLVFRNELQYSVHANHLRKGDKVAVFLDGQGAPTEPLRIETVLQDDGEFNNRFLGFTESELGVNKKGLPVQGLSAGDYTLRMTVNGEAVASHSFKLIDVPTVLGNSVLQTDPTDRAYQPYLAGPYLLMWVPVDATTSHDPYFSFWWVDGKFMADHVDLPEVSRVRLTTSLQDAPLFELAPIVFRKESRNGSFDVALDHGQDSMGLTHYEVNWTAEGTTLVGITPALFNGDNPAGNLDMGTLSDAQMAKVKEMRIDRAGRKRDPNFREERGLPESLACGLNDSADVRVTYEQLLRQKELSGESANKAYNAVLVTRDPQATEKERNTAKQFLTTASSQQKGYDGALKEVGDRLDKQTSAYKPGCMDALRPAAYASLD